METIQVNKSEIIKSFEKADVKGKKILISLYGKELFDKPKPVKNPVNIMDKIKDFNDILKLSGKKMSDVVKKGDTPDEKGYKMGKLIATVYNQGKKVEAKNTSQWKYMPYFFITPDTNETSGFGFSFDYYATSDSRTFFAFRLAFLDSNHAVDAGKKFPEIYRQYMV